MLNHRPWGLSILFIGMLLAQADEQVVVNEVTFLGNNSLPKRELKKNINIKESFLFSKTKLNRRILKLDALKIKNFYQSHGFLNTSVRDSFAITENQADIYFIISEGQQRFVSKIDINGNNLIIDKIILNYLKLRINKPLNPIALKTNISLIEEKYHSLGKLFASIKIERTITDSAYIAIDIVEGPDVHVQNTYIEGADSSHHLYIKRELTISKHDLFDLDEIQKSQRQLLEAGQYSFANIYPVRYMQSDSLVNLVAEVRYFPKREISSEGGFVPIEVGGFTTSGPGAFLQWKNRSLFGSAIRFSTKTSLEIPTDEGLRYPLYSINMDLENQWFMGVRFPTKVQLLYEVYKKYRAGDEPSIQRYGFNWSTINRLSETSFIEFGMRWEKFNQEKSDGTRIDVEQRMISLKTKLDYADHPVYPSRGVVFTGDLFSIGGPVGGTREYQKVDAGIQLYLPFPGKTVFAGRIKYGMIFNWDEDYNNVEDVLFEKYYLGGTKTLRGWKALQFPETQEPDSLFLNGKEIRFLTNGELRFPIVGSLGGAIFADGGQLWDFDERVNLKNLQWDAGAGITYSSPFGPIRLEYAYQIDDPEKWEVLVDVLYAF